MNTIVFCLEPFTPSTVDFAYAEEAAAAAETGFAVELIDFEALTRDGDGVKATRRIKPQSEVAKAMYRGWMLKPAQYELLFAALLEKNIALVNSPAEYAKAHYFPGTYFAIQGKTAKSVYFPVTAPVDFALIHQKLRVFGSRSIIVKDYVKSRKYEWTDACFIRAADDEREVERVVGNFLMRQGDDLNEGLVFREFLDLEATGELYPGSTYPLAREHRFFVYRDRAFFASDYWDGQKSELPVFPDLQIENAVARVGTNFFTVDVARTVDGGWTIIEIGDGQVSGLPDGTDERQFYRQLRLCL